ATGDEVAGAAPVADEAVSTVPPDADAISLSPGRHAGSDVAHDASHLVPWHARQLEARKLPPLHERVAVTDTAGRHLDLHLTGTGRRHLAGHELEFRVCGRHLCGSHRRHGANMARLWVSGNKVSGGPCGARRASRGCAPPMPPDPVGPA